jgi:ABC-type lipoprotein release transport system permease subunit
MQGGKKMKTEDILMFIIVVLIVIIVVYWLYKSMNKSVYHEGFTPFYISNA